MSPADGPGPAAPLPFWAHPILAALERHHVDYVVVGGCGARLHGAERPTSDVDVAPCTTTENLQRLAAALRELGARIRTGDVDGGLAVDVSGESLVGVRVLNLTTDHGDVDLAIRPAAFEDGYADLINRAGTHTVGDLQVHAAALSDIIRSKETAARAKDLRALPELHALARGAAAAEQDEPEVTSSPTEEDPAAAAEQRIARAREEAAERRRDQDRKGWPAIPSGHVIAAPRLRRLRPKSKSPRTCHRVGMLEKRWTGPVTGVAAAALLLGMSGCAKDGEAVATWDVAPGQVLEDDTDSFTALVTRLGCNGGVTGVVSTPRVDETDDAVTITFTVSPGPPEAADCPSNDAVPYEVELDSPLQGRLLVDGACESTEAGSTTDCDPDGTRSAT